MLATAKQIMLEPGSQQNREDKGKAMKRKLLVYGAAIIGLLALVLTNAGWLSWTG
jgi:hypothetical protein